MINGDRLVWDSFTEKNPWVYGAIVGMEEETNGILFFFRQSRKHLKELPLVANMKVFSWRLCSAFDRWTLYVRVWLLCRYGINIALFGGLGNNYLLQAKQVDLTHHRKHLKEDFISTRAACCPRAIKYDFKCLRWWVKSTCLACNTIFSSHHFLPKTILEFEFPAIGKLRHCTATHYCRWLAHSPITGEAGK